MAKFNPKHSKSKVNSSEKMLNEAKQHQADLEYKPSQWLCDMTDEYFARQDKWASLDAAKAKANADNEEKSWWMSLYISIASGSK